MQKFGAERTLVPVALCLLAGALACSSPPEASKQIATLRSWTATARLATREHRAGATPTKFTAHLSEEAASALAESRAALSRSPMSNAQRDSAHTAIDSLGQAIRELNSETRAR
mgnify:FL=1